MGVALHGQGKFAEAIKVYNKAISIKHDYMAGNIGNILKTKII